MRLRGYSELEIIIFLQNTKWVSDWNSSTFSFLFFHLDFTIISEFRLDGAALNDQKKFDNYKSLSAA